MAVSANTYGTIERVETRIGDLIEGGQFSTTTRPTRSQVEGLLDDIAAEMNAELMAQGFDVPVENSGDDVYAFQWLRRANSAEAARKVLIEFFPAEAFDPDAPDGFTNRARSLWQDFKRALDAIKDGRLAASRSVTAEVPKAFSGGQQDSDGNTKKPIFRRDLHDTPGLRSLTE